jgi:membrane protease YdiL (CAAX protease family)
MSPFFLPWDLLLLLLVLSVVVPWRGLVRVRTLISGPELTSIDRLSIYGSTIAFQWLAAGFVVWRTLVYGWTPAQLGLAPERPTLGIVLGAIMAICLGGIQFASLRQLARIPLEQRGNVYRIASRLLPRDATETLVFVALVCTVSVCEELLYRGFAYSVFQQLGGGSVWFAMVGSSALFAVGHLYQGGRGMMNTFVLGVLFAGARAWSDSLAPCVLAHLAVDLVAGLAAPPPDASEKPTGPDPGSAFSNQ